MYRLCKHRMKLQDVNEQLYMQISKEIIMNNFNYWRSISLMKLR